jgi:maleylpyruvate isomerase
VVHATAGGTRPATATARHYPGVVTVPMEPDELIGRIEIAHGRVLELLAGVPEERLRAASPLPGWSRAHVAAHLAGNARAMRRQAEYAVRGELVDFYDGGFPARDAVIDRESAGTPAELVAAVAEAQRELEQTWRGLKPDAWDRPVRWRRSTVLDTLYGRWREAEIHAADLDLGYRPQDWPEPFARHALDFLAPRVPAGSELTLRADDADLTMVLGAGVPVEVSGALRDLAAWMAGRAPDGVLATVGPAGGLPVLGPWPPDPPA